MTSKEQKAVTRMQRELDYSDALLRKERKALHKAIQKLKDAYAINTRVLNQRIERLDIALHFVREEGENPLIAYLRSK